MHPMLYIIHMNWETYCSAQHDVSCGLCEQVEEPLVPGKLHKMLHIAHEEIAKLQNDLSMSVNQTHALYQFIKEEDKHHEVSQGNQSCFSPI
jgi:hypothetical protein